jgi:Mn2+/Fe2+ NRAMP family transporter
MTDDPNFTPPADRRSATDRAHIGDIEGALGTLPAHDTRPRRTFSARLATLLAVIGPGIVVMVADNDAGSFSVFAQAGQNHGTGLIWVIVLLCPALFVMQEMAARLGATTGVGFAMLIRQRFGRIWSWFSLTQLFGLNIATLLVEFIGVRLALGYFGVSRYVAVPLAAGALITVTAGGRFRRWERAMYVMIALDLALIPVAAFAHFHGAPAAVGGHAVSQRGDHAGLLLLLALFGSSLTAWQLFFQQSSVIDKRITPRWLNYERADTAIGAVLFGLCAAAVVAIAAAAIGNGMLHGHFHNVGDVLSAVDIQLGGPAAAVLAIMLLNASLLCAGAVSLSGSYALAELLGTKHSLHRRFSDAPWFHAAFAGMIVLAAAIALIPGLPPGSATVLVQAGGALLLPPMLVLLLLLANDHAVLGPQRNRWIQNAAAAATIAFLAALSMMLALRTVFPGVRLHVNNLTIPAAAAAVTVAVVLAHTLYQRLSGSAEDPDHELTPWERRTWTTPALERIDPPSASRLRTAALAAAAGYVAVVAVLLGYAAAGL